jgi:hypothetical protein
MPNDVALVFYPEANSAELFRRDDHWDIWYAGSLFAMTFDSIPRGEIHDAVGGAPSEDQVVEFVERQLMSAGYVIAQRKNVPGTLAAWDLVPTER